MKKWIAKRTHQLSGEIIREGTIIESEKEPRANFWTLLDGGDSAATPSSVKKEQLMEELLSLGAVLPAKATVKELEKLVEEAKAQSAASEK